MKELIVVVLGLMLMPLLRKYFQDGNSMQSNVNGMLSYILWGVIIFGVGVLLYVVGIPIIEIYMQKYF